MTRADEIREELESMGNRLAGIPRMMPYAVPDGYFVQMPGATLGTPTR